MKRMLDYAMTCGLINHNPVSALPMRHVYKAVERDRALTTAEVQAFLRGVRAANIRRQFKLAFHLILATLVRKSELMLAQWKDVHFDSAEWHVPKDEIYYDPQLPPDRRYYLHAQSRLSRHCRTQCCWQNDDLRGDPSP
jgi:integrase